MKEKITITAYLAAAVAANLTIQYLGPAAMPLVAFLMIGLDLTSRDYLHEAWEGKGLVRHPELPSLQHLFQSDARRREASADRSQDAGVLHL